MKRRLLIYSLGVWGILVVCAIVNAGLREGVLTPAFGDTVGRAMSTVTLSAIILLVSYVFVTRAARGSSEKDLWLVGALWLSLTVAFEFGFGHFVMGRSLDTLLFDYNMLEGRIWVMVLVVTLTAPYLTDRLAKRLGS